MNNAKSREEILKTGKFQINLKLAGPSASLFNRILCRKIQSLTPCNYFTQQQMSQLIDSRFKCTKTKNNFSNSPLDFQLWEQIVKEHDSIFVIQKNSSFSASFPLVLTNVNSIVQQKRLSSSTAEWNCKGI